jgi:hypothetical protein
MTLTEEEATAKFKSNKRKFIKVLGRKSTTDQQLTTLGKKLFGNKYVGTYAQDYKPTASPVNQYFIINTDLSGKPGTHWVAIVKNEYTYYIYDSFARTAKRLLPVFTKGRMIIESDLTDAEQQGSSEVCGVLCLAWLKVAHNLGIRSALKV